MTLLCAAGADAQASSGPQGAGAVPADLEAAEQRAARWLLAQMVPNEVVEAPAPDRRRLLLSYRVPREDPAYRYVYGRTFVYDDALGAIALGRYPVAGTIRFRGHARVNASGADRPQGDIR